VMMKPTDFIGDETMKITIDYDKYQVLPELHPMAGMVMLQKNKLFIGYIQKEVFDKETIK